MKPRTHFYEVHVHALISSAVFAESSALKVFKVDPPAMFLRIVSRKIVHGAGRPFADTSDVVSNLCGQIVYVVRAPRIVSGDCAALGEGQLFTESQKAEKSTTRSGRSWNTPT